MTLKHPPRAGDEDIVRVALRRWKQAGEPWVPFNRLEGDTRAATDAQRDSAGRYDRLDGRRLVTVLQRLKRADEVQNRMPVSGIAVGTSEWRLR